MESMIEAEGIMDFYKGYKNESVTLLDGNVPMVLFVDCPEIPHPDRGEGDRGVAVVMIPQEFSTEDLPALFEVLKSGPLAGKEVLGAALASDTYYLMLPPASTMEDVRRVRSAPLQQLFHEGHPDVTEALTVSVYRNDGTQDLFTVPYGTNDDGTLDYREPVDYGSDDDVKSIGGRVGAALRMLVS